MERVANITLAGASDKIGAPAGAKLFGATLLASALSSALLASWLPLQFSVITVFLFAGPHNLFEFRYFLTRMPARFGKSRNFFLVAFGGICFLTTSYLVLPALYYLGLWSGGNWVMMIAVWNSVLLLWIATLVWMRGNQSTKRDWFWAWPVSLSLISINWMAPELFSLGIVYLHPLIALWFLDRQLRRSRPGWVPTYHLFLGIFLLLVLALLWQLSGTQSLNDDNGLAWRVTQHAGAELLSGVSTHLLVSLHVFLEMLHYLVWLVALPLLSSTGKIWKLTSIPLVQHPRGFPRLIGTAMALGCLAVALLWLGFSLDYAATRDIYFAVAIAHVLAEAPFLLRTI